MRKTGTIAFLAIVLAGSMALSAQTPPEPRTEDEKSLYAIGVILSRNIGSFNLTPAELDVLKAGLTDGALDRPRKVDLEAQGPKVQAFTHARTQAGAAEEKKKGAAFLETASLEKGARTFPSGLVVTELKPGTGASPRATDTVKVHYTGTLIDGTVFDSSAKRGRPAEFPLGGVIHCWTEGVQTMKVGGKSKLVCPSDIAYGDQGQSPAIRPGATLVFEVELLEIMAAAAPASPHEAPEAPKPTPAGKT